MTVSLEFVEHCHKKAARFLKSVVIIDDEITWESTPDLHAMTATKPSLFPLFGDTENIPVVDSSRLEGAITDSNLAIAQFTRSFAQHGIVAGFLKPNFEQDDVQKTINDITKLSAAADVMLIDWKLNSTAQPGQEHKVTVEAIKEILSGDIRSGGRARLIVIYTSENCGVVSEQILGGIKHPTLKKELDDPDERLRSATCFSYEHGLIAIISKAEIRYSDDANQQVHDIVVRLFSKLNRGLLASTALDAIAVIREKTHHFLSQFNREFDGAFVAHRCLSASPEDAEEFAEKLIGDELRIAIALQRVGADGVKHDNIMRWANILSHEMQGIISNLSGKYNPKNKFRDAKAALSIKGNAAEVMPSVIKKFFHESMAESAPKAFNHLSCMVSLEFDEARIKSYGTNWVPYLTLGSVLFSKGRYYLCMIPKCDSVRISDQSKSFPMLCLETVGDLGKANLVVPHNGEFIRLHVDTSSNKLMIVDFPPNLSGYVSATADRERHFFYGKIQRPTNFISPVRIKLQKAKTKFRYTEAHMAGRSEINDKIEHQEATKRNLRFQWVAELRSDKAIQFSQNLGSHLNRVGLDDFEPLRLLST